MNYPQNDNYGTSYPPPQKSGGKGWTVVLIILGAILCLGCLCCGGGGLWIYFAAEEPDVAVTTSVPAQCKVGDTITLRVEVTNTGSSSQELIDLTLGHGYIDGFIVVSTTPPYTSSEDVFGMRTLNYNIDIPAGATEVIEIELQAAQAGNWVGDLDVTVDSLLSFKTQVVQTNVTP